MLPVISCIMSNYNTEPVMFRKALDSVLQQTYRDFELILIDDKSTDLESRKVVEEYARRDSRVVAIYNTENQGLAGSLNIGLKWARGKYIARFDTDDICVANRFERQIEYMEKKNADICSTFSHLFGDYDRVVSTCFISFESVAVQMLFSCYIYHTPVMMKHSFLEENGLTYDVRFDGAEDFDLFSRCREAGAKICIMPEVMFHYRLHSSSVCHTQNTKQVKLSREICKRQLDNMQVGYDSDEWKCHQVLCNLKEFSVDMYEAVDEWCKKLLKINDKKEIFDKKSFEKVVYNRFFTSIVRSNCSRREKFCLIIRNRKLCSWTNTYSAIYKKIFAFSYKLRGRGCNANY